MLCKEALLSGSELVEARKDRGIDVAAELEGSILRTTGHY